MGKVGKKRKPKSVFAGKRKHKFFKNITTHSAQSCAGQHCVVHNQSNHHMKKWPMYIRWDMEALVERICSHGIGHPDPDSVAYFIANGQDYMSVHGCDGCCTKKINE